MNKKLLSVAGLIVSIAGIVLIPVILFPEEKRSNVFWIKICWVSFLSIAIWGYFGGLFSLLFHARALRGSTGSLISSFGVWLGVYVVVSSILIVADSLYDKNETLNRYHLAIQVFLFVAYLIVVVLMGFLTDTKPATGIENGEFVSPDVIIRLFESMKRSIRQLEESSIRGIIDAKLTALIQKLRYSLPPHARLMNIQSYLVFSESVMSNKGKLTEAVSFGARDAIQRDIVRTLDELLADIEIVITDSKI